MLFSPGHKFSILIIIWFSFSSTFGDGKASTNHPLPLELAPETKTVQGELAQEILLPASTTITSRSADEAPSLTMQSGSSTSENISTARSDVTLDFAEPSSRRLPSPEVEVTVSPPRDIQLPKEPEPPTTETPVTTEQQPSADSEVMPSFDEWKKKMLADQDGKKAPTLPGVAQTGSKKQSGGSRRRNYSSVECGAKIVASNSEADSPSHVLNEQLDEYMLNPCNAKIWFIIELCESIQAAQIELGNLELFSSTPREFSVAWSDRFPTRDWSPLGTFEAPDLRALHQFPLNMQGFGKFIKVEMLNRHGSEHYCPISVVRVFGTSMVDEYEEMETADRHHPVSPEVDLADPASTPDLLGSAKEAMMQMVKTVLVLQEDQVVPDNATNKLETNVTRVNESVQQPPSYLLYCRNLQQESSTSPNHFCHFLQEVPEVCPLVAPNRTSPIVTSATTSFTSQPPPIQPTRTLSESEVEASGQPSSLQTEIPPTSTVSAAEPLSVQDQQPPESSEEESAETSTEGDQPTTPLDDMEGAAKPEHIPVGSAGQQKESIFLRMGNRIRALELNMSLSSRYLQELSQRYRRQMEEMQRSFNRTVATLNETARAARAQDKAQQVLIESLRLQLANLTQGLEGLVADREKLQARMMAEHLALVVCELCVILLLLTCCNPRRSKSLLSSSASPKELLIIEPPEPKVKKKKNKKSGLNKMLHRSQSHPSLPPLPPPAPPKSSQTEASSPAAGLLFIAPPTSDLAPPLSELALPPPDLAPPPSEPATPPVMHPSPPRKVHRTPSV